NIGDAPLDATGRADDDRSTGGPVRSSKHRAVVGAPVTPRIPLVAASVTIEKSALQTADAVAVIGITAAGHTTTSEGATECECTGGSRGTAGSKADCKSNHPLTYHDFPFYLFSVSC